MKRKEKRYPLQLFILFLAFFMTSAVPMLPAGCVCAHGLFGEVTSAVVLYESADEISEISSKTDILEKIKGINIYNIWFELSPKVVCLSLAMCAYKLSQGESIVAKKVRMDT